MFDADWFVRECQRAGSSLDAAAAVGEVVETAIHDAAAIDATLGAEFTGQATTLFSSAELTVQRIQWPPGIESPAHEHRMWAVVGVYTGLEQNRIYRRASSGIEATGDRALAEGEVLVLGRDAIHSVDNPLHTRTAGLHVYGGDILSVERSAWGPDGREVLFAANESRARAMYQAMSEIAAENGTQLDDDARYTAVTALQAACNRDRRYPTNEEARRIVEQAWRPSA
jgi:predicted metal-dependent enzyme (double-stranded beta helix superfamily)